MSIRLVAFDLGGTIVDHGSMGPVMALREAFASFGVHVTEAELRAPMGKGKLDHVREMLAMPRILDAWRDAKGSAPDERAAHALHDRFVPIQVDVARQRAHFVGGFEASARELRARGIALAVTTGYPRAVGQAILDEIVQLFRPDASCCTDEVERGRPAGDMLLAVMKDTGVVDPKTVVAVGDTVPDIEAAADAGVRSIGIAATGSEVALDEPALAALEASERAQRIEAARRKLAAAGADLVLDRVEEIPAHLEPWS